MTANEQWSIWVQSWGDSDSRRHGNDWVNMERDIVVILCVVVAVVDRVVVLTTNDVCVLLTVIVWLLKASSLFEAASSRLTVKRSTAIVCSRARMTASGMTETSRRTTKIAMISL